MNNARALGGCACALGGCACALGGCAWQCLLTKVWLRGCIE